MIRVEGKFETQTEAASDRMSAALRRGVGRTAKQAQDDFRAQARAAGFRDGGRAIANTWRLQSYPESPAVKTWRPGALVWSKLPLLVETFATGAVIQARRHKYLAVPTAENRTRTRARGRKGGGAAVRVSTEAMARSKRAFMIPLKGSRNVLLWCLRIVTQRGKRGAVRLQAGHYGALFAGRNKANRALREKNADRDFVIMFMLFKRVELRRRLDFPGVVKATRARLGANVRAELSR